MLTEEEYVRKSIELHLFFARIIKEHGIILYSAMIENNENKEIARQFSEFFAKILSDTLDIANENVSKEWLDSEAFVTNHTLNIESLTEKLGNLTIDKKLTEKALSLTPGTKLVNQEIISRVTDINKSALQGIGDANQIIKTVFFRMTNNQSFLYNYPELINHYTKEANMYKDEIERLMERAKEDPTHVYNTQYKLDQLMQEHGRFIRGMTNTDNESVIAKAEEFIREYEEILEKFKGLTPDVLDSITNNNLSTTEEFKQFKTYLTDRWLNSKLYMITMPIFVDHILREANYFLRKLKNFKLES